MVQNRNKKPRHSLLPLVDIFAWGLHLFGASQVALVVKNPPANAGRLKRRGFDLWVKKIPGRRARLPTPAFLPAECQGQRSLEGYNP